MVARTLQWQAILGVTARRARRRGQDHPDMSSHNESSRTGLSYRDAGVDIDAGDALVDAIKPLAARTMRDGVLAGIGGFGALFEVPRRYR